MLHIIQNDRDVPPGNFSATISEMGVVSRLVRPYSGEGLPASAEVSAAIVLGGAMGVHDDDKYPFLVEVKNFIQACVRTETPLLGVCLGGQLLADVLGGKVASNSPYREKGTIAVTLTPAGERDPLFAGISRQFVTFQWHNDSFAIPPGAVLLASSDACPGQAFSFGSAAWGTQFHPEVDRSTVDCWVRWSKKTAPLLDGFLDDFDRTEQRYLEVSRRLLGNFLRQARLI